MYVNFVLDIALDVKAEQKLARHETAGLILNTYDRAKEKRCRAVAESEYMSRVELCREFALAGTESLC